MPNGTLYEPGIAERIRQELLTEFNLHTVLRLPKGVFEPYTDIATNILFFDRSKSTGSVWFYEHPLPPHRARLKGKIYSATEGLQDEEFNPLHEWWSHRAESDHAWKMSVAELRSSGFDLAQSHPNSTDVSVPSPTSLVKTLTELREASDSSLEALVAAIASLKEVDAPLAPLASVLSPRTNRMKVMDSQTYSRPRVQLHFRGALVRDRLEGSKIGTKTQIFIQHGDMIMSRIDARNGAMAIAGPDLEGAIATGDFPVFAIDVDKIDRDYLRYALFQPSMLRVYEYLSRGSTNRRRLRVELFLELTIPIPEDLETQRNLVEALRHAEEAVRKLKIDVKEVDSHLDELMAAALHSVFAN